MIEPVVYNQKIVMFLIEINCTSDSSSNTRLLINFLILFKKGRVMFLYIPRIILKDKKRTKKNKYVKTLVERKENVYISS